MCRGSSHSRDAGTSFLFRVFLLLLAWSFGAQSELLAADLVEVQLSGNDVLNTNPGNMVTLSFRVTNLDSERRKFVPEMELPAGWREIVPELPFSLDPNSSDLRFLTIFVPGSAIAQPYSIRYRVEPKGLISGSDQDEVTVLVNEVTDVSLNLRSSEYLIEGLPESATLQVANRSNVVLPLRIQIDGGEWIEATLPLGMDTAVWALDPGEQQRFSLDLAIREGLPVHESGYLSIQLLHAETGAVLASRQTEIELIPRERRAFDPWHRFPVEAALLSGYKRVQGDAGSTQIEITGEGSLDEEEKHHLELMVRNPDRENDTPLEKHEEYSVEYQYQPTDVEWQRYHLGGDSQSFSKLSESGYSGNTILGEVKREEWLGRLYWQRNYHWNSEESRTGVWLERENEKRYFGLGLLDKDEEAQDNQFLVHTGRLARVGSEGEGWLAESELEYELATEGDSWAGEVRIRNRQSDINTQLDIQYGGADYKGKESDRFELSLAHSQPWETDLALNTNLRYTTDNLRREESQSAALEELYADLDLRWGYAENHALSGGIRAKWREDQLSSPDYDEQEWRVTLRNDRPLSSRGRLHLALEGSLKRDLKAEKNHTGLRLYSTSFWNLSVRDGVSASVEYNVNQSLDETNTQRMNLGLSWSRQLEREGSLSVDWRKEHYPSNSDQEGSDELSLTLQKTLPWKHRIEFSAGQSWQYDDDQSNETVAEFIYRIPFGVPVVRRENVATFSGSMVDAVSGKGVDNVVLTLDDQFAVTDPAGNFRFPGVGTGDHYLDLRVAGIGEGRIPDRRTPIPVTVARGGTNHIVIRATKSSTVHGRVEAYSYRDERLMARAGGDQELIKDGGVPSITVQLRREDEVREWMTDRDGSFEFLDLRPGRWKLRIIMPTEQDGRRLVQSHWSLDLDPGEDRGIEARLEPVMQQIQFLQDEEILLE